MLATGAERRPSVASAKRRARALWPGFSRRCARCAAAWTSAARPRKASSGRDRGGGEAGGQQLVLGGRDHQRREREAGEADGDEVLAPDGAELDRGGAEQLRRLGAARAQQRGQREGEGGQRAEGGGAQQRLGIDSGFEIDVDLRQRGLEQEREGGADGERDDDADGRHHADGDEIGGGDLARGRADAFQHGDDARLAFEMCAHRVGDAEPADQQRAEPDQVEIGAGVLQEIAGALAGILELADAPAGVGEFGIERGGRGGAVGVRRHLDAIGVVDQAAGLHQAGGVERLLRDQQARAEGEDLGGGIGLALDRGGDDEPDVADHQAVTDLEAGALQQHAVGERAIAAVGLLRQQFGERLLVAEGERAIERVDLVGALELDQHRQRAVGRGLGHRAHLDHVRDLAVALDRRQLFGRRRAVRQPHLHVAAEDRLGVGRDAGDRGGADRADAGDRRHTEDQARDEQAEPVRAGAQLAPGEAEGEEEGGHARCTRTRLPSTPLVADGCDGGCRRTSSRRVSPSLAWRVRVVRRHLRARHPP